MKLSKKIFFLFAIVSVISLKALAQDPGDPPNDPDVPLDGGLSIALAMGIGYGAKKLLKKGTTENRNYKIRK